MRVVEMTYKDGEINVVLCIDGDRCYRAVYIVLDKEEFEKRLAQLIGESNFDALISYKEGDLPEEN